MSALFKHSRNTISMAKKSPKCEPINLQVFHCCVYSVLDFSINILRGGQLEKLGRGLGNCFPSMEMFLYFARSALS